MVTRESYLADLSDNALLATIAAAAKAKENMLTEQLNHLRSNQEPRKREQKLKLKM